MDKHIHYHMVEIGGDFNYIDRDTGEHIYNLGSGGTLDDCQNYIYNLEQQLKSNENYCVHLNKLLDLDESESESEAESEEEEEQ